MHSNKTRVSKSIFAWMWQCTISLKYRYVYKIVFLVVLISSGHLSLVRAMRTSNEMFNCKLLLFDTTVTSVTNVYFRFLQHSCHNTYGGDGGILLSYFSLVHLIKMFYQKCENCLDNFHRFQKWNKKYNKILTLNFALFLII